MYTINQRSRSGIVPYMSVDASRTERFLDRFNELEQFLRESTNSRRNVPFGETVSRAAREQAAVRHFSRDLREWADLRNAVVHEHPRGRVIAEVTSEALAEFEGQVDRITAPPGVFPAFSRDIRVFDMNESLIDAIQDLWNERHSQVIVKHEGRLKILSFAGITRWMGANLTGTTLDLNGATVGDAMAYEEDGGITFLPRTATIYDARERFQHFPEREKQRLRAIVITENGKNSESPLGLLTASDLLEIEI